MKPFGQVPFQAHVELLRIFLAHREEIVARIEAVLNAQRKPSHYSVVSRQFEDCFFAPSAITANQTDLRGQLEQTHWTAGFKPRPVQHVYNDLIHPVEMMIRGVYCWQQTRWPGRSGRIHYAHTLFNVYVLRCLQFLSLRISGGGQLTEIQRVLDELWRSSPAGQPAFVRDARWLIPLAQSVITDELAPYFEVAQRIRETLPEADVLEIQKAHVRMLGGHLTSQIRYYCTKDGVSIDHPSVVLRTRNTNALDFALLVQGLVGLLRAYDRALQNGDERLQLDMAGAIYQGISPDPELFLNRIDLLSAYTMIEHVVLDVDYSPLYGALMDKLIPSLRDDLPRFRPVEGGCSPYGVIFGLPSNLIEHMALKALQHDAETRFSLEDVFKDENTSAAKLAWVNGWRQLPHIDPEVQRLYEYPQQFAEDIYNRIENELKQPKGSKTGRLLLVPEDDPDTDSKAYFADPHDQAQLLRERQEGHFLVSYETPNGWVALKKDLLTEVLATGRDARIAGLPPHAAQLLQRTGLLVTESRNRVDASRAPSGSVSSE